MVAVTGCENPQSSAGGLKGTPESPIAPISSPQPSISAPVPKVDAKRLWNHIQALNFERYETGDRARTRDYLSRTLTEYGWKPEVQAFEGGTNLVARQLGADTNAGTILVTAHYDTVRGSPGADDNASAIAAVLEIARLLGPRPTLRSLEVAFLDREEEGLQGSFAFTSNPVNLARLLGVINLEMLGYACYKSGCQKYPDGLPTVQVSDQGDFFGDRWRPGAHSIGPCI